MMEAWRNFKNAEGEPFFDTPNTFGCMLNLDWFFNHSKILFTVCGSPLPEFS